MHYFSSDFKLGILGGGQLGKMLLYETRKLDIFTHVLDSNSDSPCKIASNKFVQGDLMDFETVYEFGKEVDIITIEIENVNVDALEKLEQNGVKVFPKPKTLRTIQNKVRQKLFYVDNNLPTAPFSRFAYRDEIKTALANKSIQLPFVWKKAQFGYDGYGVKIIRNEEEIDDLPNVDCLVEDYIPFDKELSVIVARNMNGDIVTYPIVEMEFHPEANQVEYVICPGNVSKSIEAKAKDIAVKTANAFEHIGLLAVEMFLTRNNELLINEVAPRPHNSGHHTIESNFTNQFEQHLRAILNLPLGKTNSKLGAVMVNLVGQEGYSGDVKYQNIEHILNKDGVTPHIYGKKKTRPFRKMGHVTVVHENVNSAREIAENVKKTIKVISNKNE